MVTFEALYSMKLMKKLIVILLVSGAIFTGCKDKENIGSTSGTKYTAAHKAKLYDKVWYTTHPAGGLELQFLSNGVFRQALSLNGTYEWQNGGDTMNIVAYNNARFNFVFDDISDHEFTYRTDFAGDNYTTVYRYIDTK